MSLAPLSDDQVTYLYKAELIAKTSGLPGAWWNPSSTFSYFLNMVNAWVNDEKASFVVIYVITAFVYLYGMTWALRKYIPSPTIASFIAIISLIPHYTLGMTYWGFGGFEFIRARILIMPFVPVLLRCYFDWKASHRILIVFLGCCMVAVLNFEIIYMGAILCLYSLFFVLTDASIRRSIKYSHVLGIMLFGSMSIFFLYYNKIMIHFIGASKVFFVLPTYELLKRVFEGNLHQLTDMQYLDLKWEAAEKAFWWGLFPPRLSDIGLFLIEHIFILILAVGGCFVWKKRSKASFDQWVKFTLCTLVIAYGYQIIRTFGHYIMHWSPDIREEVRAFKFITFPMYISVGWFLTKMVGEKKYLWIIICCLTLFIAPVQVARRIPVQWKIQCVQWSQTFLTVEKQAYLEKVFAIKNSDQSEDIEQINSLLSQFWIGDTDDIKQSVLTTEHKIKFSDRPTLISYQDKRGAPTKYFENSSERTDLLVFWYLAYKEISQVLELDDPQLWILAAKKFECRFIVSKYNIQFAGLEKLYVGKSLNLYRIL